MNKGLKQITMTVAALNRPSQKLLIIKLLEALEKEAKNLKKYSSHLQSEMIKNDNLLYNIDILDLQNFIDNSNDILGLISTFNYDNQTNSLTNKNTSKND